MYTRSAPAARRRARLQFEFHTLESRQLMTLMGNSLFPADNAWNQRITNAPVAANSTAIVSNITSRFGNGLFATNFAQVTGGQGRLSGIPVNLVTGSTPRVTVVVDGVAGQSDLGDVPIPSNVQLEGDFQNGPNLNPGDRGKSRLLIYDADHNVSYELTNARRPDENPDGYWHASQISVWDMKVNTFRPIGSTSADAAGLSILAGLARPDEALPVNQGGQGQINHALRVTLDPSVILNQFVYPASHALSSSNTDSAVMPPLGTRLRLKPGVDISQFNPQSKVVAQALKDYGLILADGGTNFEVTGTGSVYNTTTQTNLTWSNSDIQDATAGLKSLKYSDFEVVDLRPIVAGLSASTGEAGSVITVNGQNFAGAAGRVKVLFGSAEATGVTVVNDTTIRATVPAGTGTVDVRVQSGITSDSPQNARAPIFGYGLSDPSAAARFTYGAVANQGVFVGTDTTTQGNWPAVSGQDGYTIVGDTSRWPSYATVTPSGQGEWTWAAHTSDPRALRRPNSADDRIAATWHSETSFNVRVKLDDAQPHPVSLYLLDWDRQNRVQRVDVIDPRTNVVLDTRTVSSFANGTYLNAVVSGEVIFRVTRVAGPNAVLSGLFLGDPARPASGVSFLGTDNTTLGNWQSAYGGEGYTIVRDASVSPSYATVTPAGQGDWTWAASTTDPRALLKAGSTTDRIAACWFGTNFSIDVPIRDGRPHTVSLYMVDYDNMGRVQQIDVVNPTTGAVLDTRTVTDFQGGRYLTWSLSAPVQFRVTSLKGFNAVISGVFFGGPNTPPPPPPTTNSAQFAGSNTTAQGSWNTAVGAEGYNVIGNAVQYPGYATVTASDKGDWTWAATTSDPRALRKPANLSDRIASCWHGATVNLDVSILDGQAHTVSLYLLDYDRQGRSERIDVVDQGTGAVLDSRTLSNFGDGVYLSWQVTGRVRFRITKLAGPNAVVSGVFFGGPTA